MIPLVYLWNPAISSIPIFLNRTTLNSITMSDVAENKPDPTTVVPDTKAEETTATGEGEKSTTEAAAETVTETAQEAVDTAKDAAVKTSDSVFSMFGGGPKKEKKEEAAEPTDEPSGSSKAQKADDEVRCIRLMLDKHMAVGCGHWERGLFVPLSPYSGVIATMPNFARRRYLLSRFYTNHDLSK